MVDYVNLISTNVHLHEHYLLKVKTQIVSSIGFIDRKRGKYSMDIHIYKILNEVLRTWGRCLDTLVRIIYYLKKNQHRMTCQGHGNKYLRFHISREISR